MKPTKEQQDILDASKEEGNLKVVARAGTGKSSTIRLLSQLHQEKSLYLVFNKALEEEASAKFDEHVECRTMHSLAYKEAGDPIKHKLKQNIGWDSTYINRLRTVAEVANGLGIKDIASLPKQRISGLVMDGMRRWEYSADDNISKSLYSKKELKDIEEEYDVSSEQLVKNLVQYLKKWWLLRIDPLKPAVAEHNTYVKIWQLSKPKLDYQIIYLDEAQDLFNVFYDIVANQDCKIIVVGDDKQAIYQWNGAVNSLAKFKYKELPLTQSFRYGQKVADIAVKVFPEDVVLKGNPNITSHVKAVDKNKPYTCIYRTNGALVQAAVGAVNDGINVNIEIPVKAFREKLQAVSDFLSGKKVKHPEVAIYSTRAEMISNSDNDPELRRMVNICKKGDQHRILRILDTHKNSRKPHITFCTAHKSKGREWSQVLLADDFPEVDDELSVPEQNLLYVAATRAIDVLQPNKTLVQLEQMRGVV